MAFGDDYLYSFIWQGKPMFIPLSESAVRVSSWHDLFVSQWSHYFTWSGRTVNHTIAQLFLWMGKDTFNFFNALISTVLIVEIYFAIHKGKVTVNIEPKELVMIFFALWAFTPGFVSVFLWLDGACNYLWTNTILLGFLIPYINKYYCFNKKVERKYLLDFTMFVWGIISGWTNENSICWIILVLSVFIYKFKKKENMEIWLYCGLLGLITGYCLLMFAPGNTARLYAEHGDSIWLNATTLKDNITMLLSVLFLFQVFLWYFNVRALYTIKQLKITEGKIEHEIILAKILCGISLGMDLIMVLSPIFPPRSAFSGTIFLIVATGVLVNIQISYNITLIQIEAKKFLRYIAIVYFIMTTIVTVNHLYEIHMQMQEILVLTKQFSIEKKDDIITVNSFKKTSKLEDLMSGFHIPSFSLSEDENAWMNVAFARYYGIKGIRMIKDEK